MKRTYPIAFTAFFLLPTFGFARTGADISGGGQGLVCRSAEGIVTSAKLLDMAEAEGYYLLPIPKGAEGDSYLAIARQKASVLDAAGPSIDPSAVIRGRRGNDPAGISYGLNVHALADHANNENYLTRAVSKIDKQKIMIPGDDYQIPPLSDSHPRILPGRKGCALEQIAVYQDGRSTLRIVEAIWSKLDAVNRAALLVHEALYRQRRGMGDATSDPTRKIVGHLFGGRPFSWVLDGLPSPFVSCWSTDADASFRFLVYPAGEGRATAQFLVYNGEVMVTKTAIDVNAAPFAASLGLNVPTARGRRYADYGRIENLLVDLPEYAFVFETDRDSGSIAASFEAIVNVAGTNPLPIQCSEQTSNYKIEPNGNVTLDEITVGSGR